MVSDSAVRPAGAFQANPQDGRASLKAALRHRYHGLDEPIEAEHRVGEPLGAGGQAVVSTATSRLTGQRFALKRLEIGDGSRRETLERECRLLARMDHPHIVQLHDLYESDSALWLLMEQLKGGELLDRILEGGVKQCQAAELVRQMLLAINYLHSLGVAHRDVKCENWIFEDQSLQQLKLIDFGFARELGGRCSEDCLGTPGYVAPEIFRGRHDLACDLWSLGVVAFCMLTKRMPIGGDDFDQLEERTLAGNIDFSERRWKGTPRGARDFVISLLRLEPKLRLSASAALRHPWIAAASPRASAGLLRASLASLQRYSTLSPLRRACLRAAAEFLEGEEAQRCRRAFLAMASGEGRIEASALVALFQKQRRLAAEDASAIVQALDCAGGRFTYSDFAAALCEPRELSQEAAQEAFQRFDRCQREMSTAAGDDVERSELGEDRLPRLLNSRGPNAALIDATLADKGAALEKRPERRRERAWEREWSSLFHSPGPRMVCCFRSAARI